MNDCEHPDSIPTNHGLFCNECGYLQILAGPETNQAEPEGQSETGVAKIWEQ